METTEQYKNIVALFEDISEKASEVELIANQIEAILGQERSKANESIVQYKIPKLEAKYEELKSMLKRVKRLPLAMKKLGDKEKNSMLIFSKLKKK